MAEINVRKRGDKWEYRFEAAKIEGKRKQISKGGFRTKKEALEAGTKALVDYNNTGKCFLPSEMSFADCLDEWMKNYCKIELKDTTIDGYEKIIRLHIKPILGMYYLKNITTLDVQNFLNTKFNEGFSRNRMSSFKGVINNCFRYAKKMGYISTNPATDARIPSSRAKPSVPTRSKKREIITPENFSKVIERFPEGHSCHLPLILGYRAGLRIGEVFALTWDDINFKNSTININKQIQWINHEWIFTDPKYDSCRIVTLDDNTMSLLKRTNLLQKKAQLLYGSYRKQLYCSLNKALNYSANGSIIQMVMQREDGTFIQPRVMQHCSSVVHHKMGIEKFDFHSLRHTHTSMLLEAGVEPKVVQERLGHKNIETTLNVYAHVTEHMKDTATEKLNLIYKS